MKAKRYPYGMKQCCLRNFYPLVRWKNKCKGGLEIFPYVWDNRRRMTFIPVLFPILVMSRLVVVLSLSVCVFALFGSFLVQGQRPEIPVPPNQGIRTIAAPQAWQAPRAQRIREGTAFRDMVVFFRQTGDRTVLHTVDGNHRFVCLENLTLERILTAMQENPEREFWRIEAEFFEFRGENFVLVRQAHVARPPAVDVMQASP